MLVTIIWVLFCAVAAFLIRDRLDVALLTVLSLRILLPSPASEILVGTWSGAWSVHPASYFVAAILLVQIFTRSHLVVQEIESLPLAYWGLSLFFGAATIWTVAGRGLSALPRMLNVLLIPIVIFALIRMLRRENVGGIHRVLTVWRYLAVGEVLLALIQKISQSMILFEYYTRQQWWYTGGPILRSMGTLDNPLDLSMFLVVSIPLALAISHLALRWSFIGLCVVGIVLTGSRTGAIISVLAILGVTICSVQRRQVNLIIGLSILMLGIGFFFDSTLSAGLRQRIFVNDGNSSATRDVAVRYTADHLFDHVFAGGGFGWSFSLQNVFIESSLENGYAILAFDAGLTFAVVYLWVQARALFSGGVRIPGGRMAGMAAIIICLSYSSFMTQSACGVIAWIVFALASGIRYPESEMMPETVAGLASVADAAHDRCVGVE